MGSVPPQRKAIQIHGSPTLSDISEPSLGLVQLPLQLRALVAYFRLRLLRIHQLPLHLTSEIEHVPELVLHLVDLPPQLPAHLAVRSHDGLELRGQRAELLLCGATPSRHRRRTFGGAKVSGAENVLVSAAVFRRSGEGILRRKSQIFPGAWSGTPRLRSRVGCVGESEAIVALPVLLTLLVFFCFSCRRPGLRSQPLRPRSRLLRSLLRKSPTPLPEASQRCPEAQPRNPSLRSQPPMRQLPESVGLHPLRRLLQNLFPKHHAALG
mmetsp:Transcript_27226/g.76571  ORF Transcript_27226/g.76571 Transcript_27226/m.76571 type:complete len:267 (-) Transcript_27226:449-1249(-)